VEHVVDVDREEPVVLEVAEEPSSATTEATREALAARGDEPRRAAPSAPKCETTVAASRRKTKRQSHHP
jgi:hypothetical protein